VPGRPYASPPSDCPHRYACLPKPRLLCPSTPAVPASPRLLLLHAHLLLLHMLHAAAHPRMHVGTARASGTASAYPGFPRLTPRQGSRGRVGRYNIRSSFETSRCNNCNIRLKTMKHLKYASETLAKTPGKYLKPLQNICNI